MNQNPLEDILDNAKLIVCAGPGGVGKTTTAATIALTSALRGRRAIVLTIDPAKRLASSLGIESLSNTPQEIDLEPLADSTITTSSGGKIGQLWAMMLDQQETMDNLVNKYAPDENTINKTRGNNIYRLMSTTLSGMQEYMALDKLYDLYTDKAYDLVVLDTPPTKNALEFLETPRRASTFFDERILKWFMPSREKKEGFFKRVIGFDTSSIVLKIMRKVFGNSFIDELTEFFDTLYFLQTALKDRGEMIDFILRNESSKFVLICSPDPRRIHEALFFHYKLAELEQSASAIILNRVLHRFQTEDVESVTVNDLPKVAITGEESTFLDELKCHYEKLARLSLETRSHIAKLAERVGNEKLVLVPMMGEDIHSLNSLETLSYFLFRPITPT